MICAIDIGNTKAKAYLIDDNLTILEKVVWSTPDLFEPDKWDEFFEALIIKNIHFELAEKRISCVSWRAFLALRVFLKYDTLSQFDPYKKFNSDLLIFPVDSPIVSEAHVPVNREFVYGMIGSDRLLAAYATHKLFDKSMVVVSLGTATTIDLITNTGTFFSGVVSSGIDSSYQGLLYRAPHLMPLSDLPCSDNVLNDNIEHSLYAGVFVVQALVIEAAYKRLLEESQLESEVNLVLTGGRSFCVSTHIRQKHYIVDDLIAYGLALIPFQNKEKVELDIKSRINMSKIIIEKEDTKRLRKKEMEG